MVKRNEIYAMKLRLRENLCFELKIQFKNHSIYENDLNQKKIDYLKNEIKSIYTDDKLRALGRYFRQHMQRGSSVFEKNYQKIH